jgi:putative tricarboxylic transport membrane protein
MQEQEDDGPSLVSVRTMDIVVAIVLLVASAIVITDSARLGFRWQAVEGPASGYFPFYIGLMIAVSSIVNLIRAIRSTDGDKTFVSKPAFRRVLAVLIPLTVYVFFIGMIGIYVASAIFIALFMWHFGNYSPQRGAAIGVAVSLALFAMFEIWFLVPLPKGPIEDFFGF